MNINKLYRAFTGQIKKLSRIILASSDKEQIKFVAEQSGFFDENQRGYTDETYLPNGAKRKIFLNINTSNDTKLAVAIHEGVHAANELHRNSLRQLIDTICNEIADSGDIYLQQSFHRVIAGYQSRLGAIKGREIMCKCYASVITLIMHYRTIIASGVILIEHTLRSSCWNQNIRFNTIDYRDIHAMRYGRIFNASEIGRYSRVWNYTLNAHQFG